MLDWLREDRINPSLDVGSQCLPIAIRRHARAKRLTMRIAPDGSEIRITLPQWGRTKDAIAFAGERREWIERQLHRVPDTLVIGNGARVPYRDNTLEIAWQAGGPRSVTLDDGQMVFGGPEDRIASRVQKWLESQCLQFASQDLADYCQRADVPVPQIRLTRAKRRWGSCSGDRTARCIRINWRLIMAPDHVRRSVVAHEVAHLVHFDHSPAFHRLLREMFEDDLADADAWLKRRGRSLYAAFG